MPHLYSFRNREWTRSPVLALTLNAAVPACCILDDSWEIITSRTDSRVLRYASRDLAEFLSDAFRLSLPVKRIDSPDGLPNTKRILLLTAEDDAASAPESAQAGAFRITVTNESIRITGRTDRGAAQGVYYLEECMKLRGEAALKAENAEHCPRFSPRMTHSGTELDTFTDEYLAAIAHSGMDAIMVFMGSPDTNHRGFPDEDALWPGTGRGVCDLNHLIWRAAGFGLDVYVYSHFKCDKHPRDKDARNYYEGSFGQLFKQSPGLKGIIFVGECFEFPSLDPHTAGVRIQLKDPADSRPSPGWYPCFDYPELVTLVRDVIRTHQPHADIVFWTYNWGYVDKDARLSLIRALPTDISLLVTFDMFETFHGENGCPYRIDDYSVSFPGPGQYYVSEAEEAKRRGIRLYAMANTGGRTWDSGVTPYLPVPERWMKRFAALRVSHESHGLAGLMENHHYGWFPSFLTPLAQNAFDTAGIPDEEMLLNIARRDWGGQAPAALQAWDLFSRGLAGIVAADCDQYGAFRCGPTYPLLFDQQKEDLDIPTVPFAAHGGFGIIFPLYPDNVFDKADFTLLRLHRAEKARDLFGQGHALLEKAADALHAAPGSEVRSQCAVAGFLHSTYVTAVHVMQFAILKALLRAAAKGVHPPREAELLSAVGHPEGILGIAHAMRRIAADETANVNHALSYHWEDSRIGFEPTMEYIFSDAHAAWKNEETARTLRRLDAYLTSL